MSNSKKENKKCYERVNHPTFTTEPESSNFSDGGGKPGTAVGAKIGGVAFFVVIGFGSLRVLLSMPS